MKQSKYNFIIYNEEWGYWFNSLSFSYFRIHRGLSKKIESILATQPSIAEWRNVPEILRDKLLSGGFIIEDDFDELEQLRIYNQRAIDDKNYFLIVLPTLNCNYKCWYCIQDHIPSIMDDATMERVKRHIDYMVDTEKIDSLRLEWFGGEPLMYFKKVVIPISEYAITKCEEAGIPFYNSSTTNGYFLNENIVPLLKDLKFGTFQITLDGAREAHNKVKFMEGCVSTFDLVLDNINKALSRKGDLRVNLRINYTHSNLTSDIVEQVNSHIAEANRGRVTISPHKVWQEDVDKTFDICPYMEAFEASGYQVERWNPVSNFIPCYVSKKYYNAVTPDGKIVKCTACEDIYGKNPYGHLTDNGEIEKTCEKDFQSKSFENDRCRACKRLPVCMGLCPRDYLNGCTHCKEEVLDSTFEQRLLNFLKSQYQA